MALNDDDMEAMVMLLRDKTHLVRFNASEVEAVLRFMESQGADLKPAVYLSGGAMESAALTVADLPEVVTNPREELATVEPDANQNTAPVVLEEYKIRVI